MNDDTRPVFIYFLLDPRVVGHMSCRYVGKSWNPEERFKRHMSDTRSGKVAYKYNMIRSLLKDGIEPVLMVVEECENNQEANKRERHWKKELEKYGCNLTNLTDGGDGSLGWHHTEETRQKMSKSRVGLFKGEKNPMFGRRGEKSPNYGSKRSEESRRRMSEAHVGVQAGERHPNWGKHHNDASKQKMREARIGKIASESTKQKMSVAQSGERNRAAKLSWEKVAKIRSLSEEGKKGKDIAKLFGVSATTISDILLGKKWKVQK